MEYGKPAARALLLSASLLPAFAGADSTGTNATASARITLHIAPRVQLRQVEGGGHPQLCLGHIPARHYYLLVTESERDTGERLPGRAGSYCLPASATEGGGVVTIVAQ